MIYDKNAKAYEAVSESGFFDRDWYLANYPDVAASGQDPLLHYLKNGNKERRDPSAGFQTAYYLENNPDVLASGFNALVHYVHYGQKEGRRPLPPAAGEVPIYVVYHIGVLGTWEEIVKEQAALLESSGLGSACTEMFVQMVGVADDARFLQIASLFRGYGFWPKIRFSTFPSLESYEFPSIKQAQALALKHPRSKIFYFHTKGASNVLNYRGADKLDNLAQWRKVMEYFNIKRWRDCVAALDEVDACGIEWGQTKKERGFIFAGNFWWANGAYVNRCTLKENDRFDCEDFIGTGQPRVKNFFSSGDNPRLREYFTEEQIRFLAPPKAFYNLRMFYYWRFYLEPKYYLLPEDM